MAPAMAVADALGPAGATVDDRARPDFSAEHSHTVFSALLSAAMAARLPDEEFARRIAKADGAAADDHSPAVTQARWQTLRVRDWAKFNEARNKLRWAWRRFFDDVDFLITPVMPVTAFRHDHGPEGSRVIEVNGASVPYFNQTFWAGLAGVVFLPATVFPAGVATDGLPVGLQIIGPAYGDIRTIQLAQRLEQLGFGFVAPPAYA